MRIKWETKPNNINVLWLPGLSAVNTVVTASLLSTLKLCQNNYHNMCIDLFNCVLQPHIFHSIDDSCNLILVCCWVFHLIWSHNFVRRFLFSISIPSFHSSNITESLSIQKRIQVINFPFPEPKFFLRLLQIQEKLFNVHVRV